MDGRARFTFNGTREDMISLNERRSFGGRQARERTFPKPDRLGPNQASRVLAKLDVVQAAY